ncbi:nitrogen fixation negative regulator NifL [Plasticicumulans acidivorans]|uniref:histidine kinase n=1 Tax=Plasticicumulans acidivorans TaxID=886464 RepID=A0A317MQ35_9GAMM|nr:nitrogen fixation negative regulator NifL [Plasticicumulans acidivorans]PWV58613.1 protein-histidine pros-kinase [Plasticicumulans acidivorans]
MNDTDRVPDAETRDQAPQDADERSGAKVRVLESIRDTLALAGGRLPLKVFLEAVEQSSVAISITDASAQIIYANPAFERTTGYAPTEVLGHNESILSYKTTPRAVYQSMWAALSAHRPWSGRLVNRRKSGEPYIAELTITPVLDVDGSVTHYLGMHRDVTEVHRLAHEVANHKALMEAVVDGAPVAMALVDESGRVVLDNHAYKALIGDLGEPEPARAAFRALGATMGTAWDLAWQERRGFSEREIVFERPGPRPARWFTASGVWIGTMATEAGALFQPHRTAHMLLILQDVSALKRRQQEQSLAAVRQLLADQELVHSLREALRGAAYQLEAPLNMIGAALRLLERRGALTDAQALAGVLRDALDTGRDALERLQSALPVEHEEALTPLNFNELVRDVLMLATERLLATGVTVSWEPEPTLPSYPGRAIALRNALKQLVDNAIEAMDVRGRSQRELHIVTAAEGDSILVTIEDTGPGIPDELRLKVFEPFFTTKRASARNSGMGLPIAQDIVTRHDATLDISSGERGGCRIDLRFPLHGVMRTMEVVRDAGNDAPDAR